MNDDYATRATRRAVEKRQRRAEGRATRKRMRVYARYSSRALLPVLMLSIWTGVLIELALIVCGAVMLWAALLGELQFESRGDDA